MLICRTPASLRPCLISVSTPMTISPATWMSAEDMLSDFIPENTLPMSPRLSYSYSCPLITTDVFSPASVMLMVMVETESFADGVPDDVSLYETLTLIVSGLNALSVIFVEAVSDANFIRTLRSSSLPSIIMYSIALVLSIALEMSDNTPVWESPLKLIRIVLPGTSFPCKYSRTSR